MVDDSPAMRAYMRATLEGDGVEEVVEAASGAEALRHLPRGGFSLVLLDVNLPDLSGLEVLAFTRRLPACASLTVVIVTSEDRDEDRSQAMALGANGYVTKPFSSSSLLDSIRAHRSAA